MTKFAQWGLEAWAEVRQMCTHLKKKDLLCCAYLKAMDRGKSPEHDIEQVFRCARKEPSLDGLQLLRADTWMSERVQRHEHVPGISHALCCATTFFPSAPQLSFPEDPSTQYLRTLALQAL